MQPRADREHAVVPAGLQATGGIVVGRLSEDLEKLRLRIDAKFTENGAMSKALGNCNSSRVLDFRRLMSRKAPLSRKKSEMVLSPCRIVAAFDGSGKERGGCRGREHSPNPVSRFRRKA